MNSNSDSNDSQNKVVKILKSLLFDLPFDEYHTLYKTGIISKMSNQEKINFVLKNQNERRSRQLFNSMITLRPNILDDEDKIELTERNNKIIKARGMLMASMFLTGSYTGYHILFKNYKKIKYFVIINFGIIVLYQFTYSYMDSYYATLHEKYKNIIKEDELMRVFKSAYNID